MTAPKPSDPIWQLQSLILEAIARGEPLTAVGDLMCHEAEKLAPTAICSILTVDARGHVHPLTAPSLPDHYSRAIDGIAIGPVAGSCGTAAYRGEPVEVTDIASDPLWAAYRALALPLGLAACWSSPIKARDGRVIGTFAFYYRTKRGPSELERQIVDASVHVCAIAIERDEEQARVRHLAWYDELTGLPNRALYRSEAGKILRAGGGIEKANVLYLDLDDFKGVNDTLGHLAGDVLLKRVGERLAPIQANGIFVARLGGDEFAIVQPGTGGRADAESLAETILAAFNEPFDIEDRKVAIAASIGIAQAPSDGTDLSELSRRADMALYAAKQEAGGSYHFFEAAMEVGFQERRSLKQSLRSAFDNGELTLEYQPIVILEGHQTTAFEALLRWRHPTRGNVPPSAFVPLAEEMGLIGPIGEWVLREACFTAASWPEGIGVSVNLSPLQLRKPGLALSIVRTLGESGLLPSRLDLEITESALLSPEYLEVALRELHALKDVGVNISLDDFGTGYSSLRHLRSFPFAKIKIDKSFVGDIGRNAGSTAIVKAVISLAKELGIETTAEGVETEAQGQWLAERGCTEGQGFFFGQAMAKADVLPLLALETRGGEFGLDARRIRRAC